MQEQERGGAAFTALVQARVAELEAQRGAPITPAMLSRWVADNLVNPDRAYDISAVQAILKGKRQFPDAEEVHAWCEALQMTGERRARAFWTVGIIPPEMSADDLAAALGGRSSKRSQLHLTGEIRAGRRRPAGAGKATTQGRRTNRR